MAPSSNVMLSRCSRHGQQPMGESSGRWSTERCSPLSFERMSGGVSKERGVEAAATTRTPPQRLPSTRRWRGRDEDESLVVEGSEEGRRWWWRGLVVQRDRASRLPWRVVPAHCRAKAGSSAHKKATLLNKRTSAKRAEYLQQSKAKRLSALPKHHTANHNRNNGRQTADTARSRCFERNGRGWMMSIDTALVHIDDVAEHRRPVPVFCAQYNVHIPCFDALYPTSNALCICCRQGLPATGRDVLERAA